MIPIDTPLPRGQRKWQNRGMQAPLPKPSGPINEEALRRVYLFASLTPQEIKFLTTVVKRREIRAGAVVFREGDPAISLFIVESGQLKVVKTNPNGGEPIVLTTLGTGTLFGEIPFVAGGNRTANIMSQEYGTVLEITYDELERLIQLNPQFGVKLYKSLATYMANALKRTTEEIAGPKPQVRAAGQRGANPATNPFIPRPVAAAPAATAKPGAPALAVAPPMAAPVAGVGPTQEAPGAKVNEAGEIIIEIDD